MLPAVRAGGRQRGAPSVDEIVAALVRSKASGFFLQTTVLLPLTLAFLAIAAAASPSRSSSPTPTSFRVALWGRCCEGLG